jgi:monothiol glutaredoxin
MPIMSSVRQITVQELEILLAGGGPLELWDVRTAGERDIASIHGARLLDQSGAAYLEGLARDTPLIFHCHHGIRSQSAGEYFAAKGFTNICNVVGGIEAWSLLVDPSVPRY